MATPADAASLRALGPSRYLRLTTFRRDGTPVPTPVWVVPDRADRGGRDGDLLVTTGADSGKAKRLRRTPRVLVVPCDRRGRVAGGAVELEAVAEVLTDAAVLARTRALLLERHPVQGRLFEATEGAAAAVARLRGRPPLRRATLRISPAGA